MIDLPGVGMDAHAHPEPTIHANRRRAGHRVLWRWTGLGLVCVVGLTALAAGFAYHITSTQQAARAAVVREAASAYQLRLAAEDANLAAVQRRSRKLAATLARDHALLLVREHAHQLELTAASAAAARAAAATPVYAAAPGGGSHTAPATTTPSRTTSGEAPTPISQASAPDNAGSGNGGGGGGGGTDN